jgi:hypothetical protein
MCQNPPVELAGDAPTACAQGASVVTLRPQDTSSRRRRVWELGTHAHCPVVGVCLPMRSLRRLVDKRLGGQTVAGDYELHCGVIAECQQRTPMAEAVQRELDRRCAIALRQTAKLKTTEALALWWQEASGGSDVAGALWATLTHARCSPALEEQVLRDIHMLQHQLGAAHRVDLQQLNDLWEENAVLTRELAAAQGRATAMAREQSRRIEQLQSQAVQLRAELIGRDTVAATLREELRQLEQSLPGLKSRVELVRMNERLIARTHDLERALLQAQQKAECAQRRADTSALAASERLPQPAIALLRAEPTTPQFDDRAVLCVGGRQASVPVYRKLIERTGGRFLHHDGGEEDSPAKLDATLAAADLVICQTGCISHDAYWRVKDHCKRTGKRCVFVENPSSASLRRALDVIHGPVPGSPARAGEREPPDADKKEVLSDRAAP